VLTQLDTQHTSQHSKSCQLQCSSTASKSLQTHTKSIIANNVAVQYICQLDWAPFESLTEQAVPHTATNTKSDCMEQTKAHAQLETSNGPETSYKCFTQRDFR
jgi:hypothetical protein